MDFTRFPPSILALAKAYVLVFSVAFGGIKSVKFGIHTYDHFTGPQNTTVTFPQEPAVVQYSQPPEPCSTCLYVDIDDNLLDYYGRPFDVDRLVASSAPHVIGFSPPLSIHSTAAQTTTGTSNTPSVQSPEPSPLASGTPGSERTMFWADMILSWVMSPQSQIIFQIMNAATSGTVRPRRSVSWFIICQRLASMILYRAAVAFFKRLRKSRSIQRANAAASTANAQMATRTNVTQNTVSGKFTKIIHEYQQDPARMISAIQQTLVEYDNKEKVRRAKWQATEQQRMSDIAVSQVKEVLAVKKAKMNRIANKKARRVRSVAYWKGRRTGYTSAVEEQKENIPSLGLRLQDRDERLGTDDTNGESTYSDSQEGQDAHHKQSVGTDECAKSPLDNSTTLNNKVVLTAEFFGAFSDEELENLPEWHEYLASTVEETSKSPPLPSVPDFDHLTDDEIRLDPAWLKYIASTAVKESECLMSGALQDDGHMANWIREEEGSVWPTGYPDYQPPTLRLINLETVVEDETEENHSGAAQSVDADHLSCPLEEHDALEGGSLSQQDCGTKRILSPDEKKSLERIITVQSLSFAELQVEYLKAGHGTRKDPMAKPVPKDATTSAAGEGNLSLRKRLTNLGVGHESVAEASSDASSDSSNVSNGESQTQLATCTDSSLQPYQAELQPKKSSKTKQRNAQRKRAKAKKHKEAFVPKQ